MQKIDRILASKIDSFLAALAYGYQTCHTGDMLIDHQTIFETLEDRGEIEVYISKNHFDTEKRFDAVSPETGRKKARGLKWGEYIILMKIEDGKFKVGYEIGNDNAGVFPADHFDGVDEVMWYDYIDEHGERKTSQDELKQVEKRHGQESR